MATEGEASSVPSGCPVGRGLRRSEAALNSRDRAVLTSPYRVAHFLLSLACVLLLPLYCYPFDGWGLKALMVVGVVVGLVISVRVLRRRVVLSPDGLVMVEAVRRLTVTRGQVVGAEVEVSEDRLLAGLCHVVVFRAGAEDLVLMPLMGYVLPWGPNRRLEAQADEIRRWAGARATLEGETPSGGDELV